MLDTLLPLHCHLQLIGEFKNMQGTWIAIEVRCERKAHPAPRSHICYLLLAQGLDLTLLQASVGRVTVLAVLGYDRTEHHAGINSLIGSYPTFVGIFARQTW